jgi:hypothetical protein
MSALQDGLERLAASLEAVGETEDAAKVRGWLGDEPKAAPKTAAKKTTSKKEG